MPEESSNFRHWYRKHELSNLNRPKGFVFWSLVAGIAVLLIGTALISSIVWAKNTLTSHKPEKKVEVPVLSVFRTTDFSTWGKTSLYVNDLEITDGQLFKLQQSGYDRQKSDFTTRPKAVRDPQGYVETPQDLSENSFVCSKITSLTNEIDYTTRLNKKLQVITGDGDNQTVGLKLVTNINGQAGQYQAPDPPAELAPGEKDPHVDDKGRYHLDKKFPEKTAFVTCLQIVAPRGRQSQVVTVEMVVLDGLGNRTDMGLMPKWTVNTPTEINGTNRFSIGLIDSRNHHPAIEVEGFCAVEMKDYRDHPSDREKNACIFP